MGRGTWYYSLGVFLAIVDAFVRSEVDVRTYPTVWCIDGSEANKELFAIPRWNKEVSLFTFDSVPLSVAKMWVDSKVTCCENVPVLLGGKWRIRVAREDDRGVLRIKMYVKFSNKPRKRSKEEGYLDVEETNWRFDSEASTIGKRKCRFVNVGVKAKNEFEIDVQRSDLKSRWGLSFEYGCASFEAWYGKESRLPVLWAVTGESELNGLNLVQETTNKIVVIQERLEAAKLSKELAW
ncbi:hypothetical protein Tco_1134608 [Tanacetum coccineum]